MSKRVRIIWYTASIAIVSALIFYAAVKAATNIDATNKWAWNDVSGWMDFNITNTVNVTNTGLQGYASSSIGDISLDCNTTSHVPSNICTASTTYQVFNDGSGFLSGWGWNDVVGWISFCGGQSTSTCPGSTSYRVIIDGATGNFSGWAWNDAIGWITVCGNPSGTGGSGGCPHTTSTYLVQTTWTSTSTTGSLDSTPFDTGVSGGAQINSILWQGSLPSGTQVRFQIAASNSTSTLTNFVGPLNTGGGNDYYGPVGVGAPFPVSYTLHNNQRYFRYRIILVSDSGHTSSPRVDDVIVNWSR